MLIKIARIVLALLGLAVGYQLAGLVLGIFTGHFAYYWEPITVLMMQIAGAFLFGIILYFITPFVVIRVQKTSAFVESQVQRLPTQDIVLGTVGLIVGLIIANLIGFALMGMPLVGRYLPIVTNIVFGSLGLSVALKKREELGTILSFPTRSSSRTVLRESNAILDTSAIIDGRIADVVESGFLASTLIVPGFILEELRHIADSADAMRRNRGRRGLDILKQMQKHLGPSLQISDRDFDDVLEVDSKLIKLARVLNAKIITTDFNLNKVCDLHGVPVMNINELANALKPVAIPGEEMIIEILREGKEANQGVAFLEDGTMIVVDNGRRHIGEKLPVVVTSVLQTAAGRMIFARLR